MIEINHLQAALARVIQQYKGQPNFVGFITAIAGSAQTLEGVFFDLINLRFLGSATAAQLDTLGRIVGVERNGMSDADFQTLIQCQIKANLSSGTVEDLIAVLKPLLGVEEVVSIVESQPATLQIYLNAATPLNTATLISGLIKHARAAGIYCQLIFGEVIPADIFTLDAGPGLDTGYLAGALVS